jgi:general L-amino acid transport system substrate-binding protein
MTLSEVRRRGAVRAAVSGGLRGLSRPDAQGRWSGLDADVARAVAAAVVRDADAVEWIPVSPERRLTLLSEEAADLTVCNTTWTLARESAHPVLFAGVTCYDGEGFLVRASDGIEDPADLAGRRLAVQAGTTSTANLAAWFGPRGLRVETVSCPTPAAAAAAYADGDCAAYVLDRVALAGVRAELPDPAAHRLLDDVVSREPMAAAVRDDDPRWFRVCRWVLNLLLAAEHHGPAKAAGRAARHGPALGLDSAWAARVLDAVGSYADLYERNLGESSGLGVPRGLNELWTNGGLHYPLPLG